MRESIQTIDKLLTMLNTEMIKLAKRVEELTDNKISVCTTGCVFDRAIQLYNQTTPKEALSILKELADDADVSVKYVNEEDGTTSYKLKIDRHPFCILIKNEEDINEQAD